MCVMDSPALRMQRTVSRPTVKFVKLLVTWQHRFDVDTNFLLNPSPLHFRPSVYLLVVLTTSPKFGRNPFSEKNIGTTGSGVFRISVRRGRDAVGVEVWV